MEPLPPDWYRVLEILSEHRTPSGLHRHLPVAELPAQLQRPSLLEVLRGQGQIWLGREGVVSASDEADRDGPVIGWVADDGDLAHILENEKYVPEDQKLHVRITDAGRLALALEDETNPVVEPRSDEAVTLRILRNLKAFNIDSRVSASKVSDQVRPRRDFEDALANLKGLGLVETKSHGRGGGSWITHRGLKVLKKLGVKHPE